jgi:hypothetical protein
MRVSRRSRALLAATTVTSAAAAAEGARVANDGSVTELLDSNTLFLTAPESRRSNNRFTRVEEFLASALLLVGVSAAANTAAGKTTGPARAHNVTAT